MTRVGSVHQPWPEPGVVARSGGDPCQGCSRQPLRIGLSWRQTPFSAPRWSRPGGGTMFARVAWGKVKAGSWQDYEQLYHDEILPDTRNLKGLVFRELLQGADDSTEGISLTLWESREDLDAYEQSDVYKRIIEHARAFYAGEFWVKHFEVRLGEELKR